MKKILILLCAGKSSRFPETRPKYLLNSYNGKQMCEYAADGLGQNFNRKIAVVNKDYYSEYKKHHGYLENNFELIQIEQTSSPVESFFKTVDSLEFSEDSLLFVRDCDSSILISESIDDNAVVFSIANDEIYNKSVIEDSGNLKEKNLRIICGLYVIKRSSLTDEMRSFKNMSELLNSLGSNKKLVEVLSYADFGTIDKWTEFNRKYKTYFVDLDGVLFKNKSAEEFHLEEIPIEENIEIFKKKTIEGSQLVIVTARPGHLKENIRNKLNNLGLFPKDIICDCFHSQRVIVNDFANSNPEPSCISVNIKRDSSIKETWL